MPAPDIPAVYLVVNGTLDMSPGKIAAQSFQACERMFEEQHAEGRDDVRDRIAEWRRFTTTIVRVAKTSTMWERVKAEVEGVIMVDDDGGLGTTEGTAGLETCFVSWPMLPPDAPKILSNSKVPLL
jgi:peptidyl-tRNA hydrolase